MAQSIPSLPIPPGHLSGICHLVIAGCGKSVRLILFFLNTLLKYVCLDKEDNTLLVQSLSKDVLPHGDV